jgi:hypothetical protein
MRWVGYAAHMGEINVHKILVRKSQGKIPLGTIRYRCKVDLKTTGKRVWIGVNQLRERVKFHDLVNTIMNFQVS